MGMPSQPPPGSTGRSPRTPAPIRPAPGSTDGCSWTPAPFQPARGSAAGISRTEAFPRGSRKCTTLVDWWLGRVEGEEGKISVGGTTFTPQMMSPQMISPQMRKGASSSKGSRSLAGREFRSNAIVTRHDYTTVESKDGYRIRIGGPFNVSKSRENGFSEEVCECFEFGFPDRWQEVVNPKMVPDNEHAQSPSEATTSAPGRSVEDYMAEFLSDSFISQSRWNLQDDNARNITASWEIYGLRMHVPEKPLASPGETCNSVQESYQHESMQIDASEQEMVNHSISSVTVEQSTGSISSNSKVDGNILAPSKIPSVVNEGCGQAEEDVDIQQENMHSCSSEHGMVTLPINCTSSQLGEPGIPKSGKDSVNLGTTGALELLTEGMNPKFGAIGSSEDSTCMRLRSGKVHGVPSGGPMKRGQKQKKTQLEASSKEMVNQEATSTADMTSHENDFSAAEVVVEEKLESHDSCRRGRGRAKGKGNMKRKREEKLESHDSCRRGRGRPKGKGNMKRKRE